MSVLREIWGLFVDDGFLAAAVLGWLAAAALLLPRTTGWSGPVLFAGLAAILLASVLRGARRP